jgi:zinc and cadmium transporter
LTLHSILEGVALSASAAHGEHGSLAGFGTFLVIFLHKPLDAMTITMLMSRGGWSPWWRNVVNGLFALAIPAGVVMFHAGLMVDGSPSNGPSPSVAIAHALAFSAGVFFCISMSDLLPELQFHQHDRLKLSAALLLGLFVAYLAGRLEATVADHHQHGQTAITNLAIPQQDHVPTSP